MGRSGARGGDGRRCACQPLGPRRDEDSLMRASADIYIHIATLEAPIALAGGGPAPRRRRGVADDAAAELQAASLTKPRRLPPKPALPPSPAGGGASGSGSADKSCGSKQRSALSCNAEMTLNGSPDCPTAATA